MKILLLLRHAKSSWKDKYQRDFDRPLNDRGKKAAETIGQYIRKEGISPELVLSSTAVRARQTTDIVLRAARLQSELRYDERIYEASPSRLMEVISQIDEKLSSVLLVGHNPGMEELLNLLTASSEHMATATLAKIRLDGADKWTRIAAGKGNVDLIIRPREITG